MHDVITLVNSRQHHVALVRLWVIATTRIHPDDDLPLNAWERGGKQSERLRLSEEIRARLNDGGDIDERAAADPLALVIALDAFLGLDVAPRAFVAEPYRVGEELYWLVPLNRTATGAASSARQTSNPQSWFRHHRVVPTTLSGGLTVQLSVSRDVTDMRLREVSRAGRLRAFVGHFDDDITLEPAPSGRFFVTGLSDQAVRTGNILRLLGRAGEERADVAIFPELTVTPSQREVVKDHLSESRTGLALVVPGTFHEERDGRRVNACELLTGDGRQLFVYEKLRPFGEADGLAEDIHAANTLRVLVTPIGSVALAICKDYCDDAGPLRDWDRLAVDWWLVPSMGGRTTLDAHARRAKTLWQVINRAVTLVANQESTFESEGHRFPGFAFHGSTDATRTDVDVGGSVVVIDLSGPPKPALRRVK